MASVMALLYLGYKDPFHFVKISLCIGISICQMKRMISFDQSRKVLVDEWEK